MIFASAAFGYLARGNGNVSSVAFNHLVLGAGVGLLALVATTNIDYRVWRRFAPLLFVLSLIATGLVFLPQIGLEHGGGRRWLELAGISFQPSEVLKLATVFMAAAYFSAIRARIQSSWHTVGGLIAILAFPSVILILQPDIGTLGIIVASVLAIYFTAGVSWKYIALTVCIVLVALGALFVMKQHVRDRITTFFYPAQNQQAEGYQIKQSLIAIGSGGLTGRGFGQGVQKFTYLPEPMGDSIFAVAGEELGFIGSTSIVILFLLFALRGFTLASRSQDLFGTLLGVGITTYLVSEAFINIASMLGVLPLTGIPLTFISQGGSAMLVSLASAGILLNISKHSNIGR
ncbi:MAG: Stage V sporulation protein E [Candidatus Magasanikbacteria bacterium GW2011_GWA2_46_17]|nr:MAG: Stage V sporulation protein E [Candidatus Magasanikbacteria bacterium GW2011_GWA2_46_17]